MNETKISPMPTANDLMTPHAERAAREAGQRTKTRRLATGTGLALAQVRDEQQTRRLQHHG